MARLHAGSGRRAADRGDDDLAHLLQAVGDAADLADQAVHVDFAAGLDEFVEIADVAAGGEGLFRPFNDQDAHVRVVFRLVDDVHELVGHLLVNGVEVLHVIHRNDGDAVFYRVNQLLQFHTSSSFTGLLYHQNCLGQPLVGGYIKINRLYEGRAMLLSDGAANLSY